jgi:hypothetical protein
MLFLARLSDCLVWHYFAVVNGLARMAMYHSAWAIVSFRYDLDSDINYLSMQILSFIFFLIILFYGNFLLDNSF